MTKKNSDAAAPKGGFRDVAEENTDKTLAGIKAAAKKAKPKTDKEVKETKANAKKASKAAAKLAMKKAADKILVSMAGDFNAAGASKSFLNSNLRLDKLETQKDVINKAIRGERATLRQMKVDLRCLDRVRKLRKMEPEDVRALKATEALYEEQLNMELSPEQKKVVDDLNKQREENKKAMLNANGGDTGKEVGTAAQVPERHDIEKVPLAASSATH
jgi:hypothetical protein